MTHYLLFVHGIGRQQPGFSNGLMDRLNAAYRTNVAKTSRLDFDPLISEEAYWDDITQVDQEPLRVQLCYEGLSQYWPSNLVRRYVLDYITDEISYSKHAYAPRKYKAITGRVDAAVKRLNELAKSAGDTPGSLTVIAHSLGSLIASDALYDMMHEGRFPENLVFENFLTMGSPMALHALRLGVDEFDKPVRPRRWINFMYPQDFMSYPLKAINKAYEKAVEEDVMLRVKRAAFGNHSVLIKLASALPFIGSLVVHTLYDKDRYLIDTVAGVLAGTYVGCRNS
jgi:hypothetical protein